jgi:hypothetical protein
LAAWRRAAEAGLPFSEHPVEVEIEESSANALGSSELSSVDPNMRFIQAYPFQADNAD